MIRMARRDGRLICSGDFVADLPHDDVGWGKVSRAARGAGLAAPVVDDATGDCLFLPSDSPDESRRKWKINADTQWRILHHAHAALVRLGEVLEGSEPQRLPDPCEEEPVEVEVDVEPTVELGPAPPPCGPTLVDADADFDLMPDLDAPAPDREPPVRPAPAAAARPVTIRQGPPPVRPAPVTAAPSPAATSARVDEREFAIAVLAAQARDRGEWFRVGVCARVLDGPDALAALSQVPARTREKVAALSDAQARALCDQWLVFP